MKLTGANQVTILRVLLILPFVICMLKVNDADFGTLARYVALSIFLLMAAGDAYDGYLARKKNQVTKLGSFLDPMADKLLMTCACLLLASNRAAINGFRLPPTVVVLIIGKDLFLLLGFVIVYFITFQVRIIPARIGKIASFLQMSMVTAILIAPETSAVLPGWIWFLRFLWWFAAGTAIITTLIYIQAGSHYIEDFEEAK
ncbi:MAG: hypothetical protein GWO86_01115 [Planctomycetes bacterium]|nr:hypothetical protein [Planctomycetota bacterium]